MISKKWNGKIYCFIVFFAAVTALASRVLLMLSQGQVMDENGEAMAPVWTGILFAMILLIGASYALSVVSMLTQVIAQKGVAFCADKTGIHNTVVLINAFAFVFVFRVKFIPWHAVSLLDTSEGVYIRVKKNEIDASVFGRLVLWVMGYRFCWSFVTPKMTADEQALIETYCKTQSKYLEK